MPRGYLDVAIEPAGRVYEDSAQEKNKLNRQRLHELSEKLLVRAIWTMENVTQKDCEEFVQRCALWKREKAWVANYITHEVTADNWELVRMQKEPQILDGYEAMAYHYEPSEPDSPGDKWPAEKEALYKFIMKNISARNRHMIQLLDPEDILREERAKRASAKRRGLVTE
jgi:hypothetical protein